VKQCKVVIGVTEGVGERKMKEKQMATERKQPPHSHGCFHSNLCAV